MINYIDVHHLVTLAFQHMHLIPGLALLGGGSTGGSVVETESPTNALAAAQYGEQGAYNADQLYNQMATQGLAAMQNDYASSLQSLEPTTSEGLTAMNSLNQLLGLPAYNPGVAPTAPTAPTVQSLASQISPSQIQQYVNANISPTTNANGTYFGYDTYTGVGSQDPNVAGAMQTQGDAAGTYMNDVTKNPNTIANNAGYSSDIANYLAQQQLPAQQQLYNSQLATYNQQNALYQQGVQQQQNFQPLSAAQIQSQLSSTPGYQFSLGQGLQATQNAASAKGLANSGNTLEALAAYSSGLAQQTYGQQVQNLAGLVGAGNQASSQAASAANNLGTNTANVYTGMGTQAANSSLAATQSLMQGLLTSGQQYQTMGQGSSSEAGLGSLLGSIGGLFSSSSGGTSAASGLSGLISGLI